MPVCTNIPMIYEPEKDAVGKPAVTEIKAAGDKYTEVAANLKFTCVKVKLNLIFDPSNEEVATNFGGKPFSINSISAGNLSPFTHLYWGGKFETPTWANNEEKEEYKTGIQKLCMTLRHLKLSYTITIGLTTDLRQQQITMMILKEQE